jgi:hypothetical protein
MATVRDFDEKKPFGTSAVPPGLPSLERIEYEMS